MLNVELAEAIGSVGQAITNIFNLFRVKEGEGRRKISKTCRRFGAREDVESQNGLDKRLKLGIGIKEIRILNYASTSVLTPSLVDFSNLTHCSNLSDRIKELVCKEGVKITLIINAPDCAAADEALRSEKIINMNIDGNNRGQVFYQSYKGIQEIIGENGAFYNSYKSKDFKYHITEVALPYAIFQVKHNNSKKDYVKIDLYSPYISNESKRRTFFIYRADDEKNYKFFEENFDNVCKNAILEKEEKKRAPQWLKAASNYSSGKQEK